MATTCTARPRHHVRGWFDVELLRGPASRTDRYMTPQSAALETVEAHHRRRPPTPAPDRRRPLPASALSPIEGASTRSRGQLPAFIAAVHSEPGAARLRHHLDHHKTPSGPARHHILTNDEALGEARASTPPFLPGNPGRPADGCRQVPPPGEAPAPGRSCQDRHANVTSRRPQKGSKPDDVSGRQLTATWC